MAGLRAIMVAVDYEDLLAVTLPYNRHHFSDVLVVTDDRCCYDVQQICKPLNVEVYATQRFYEGGAMFNKWSALERGLDFFGRHGWLCLMDADVLWPKSISISEQSKVMPGMTGTTVGVRTAEVKDELVVGYSVLPFAKGCLYTPRRRMLTHLDPHIRSGVFAAPPECDWPKFPLHPNEGEYPGYSQIFHCDDSVLPSPPWHQTDWTHAGGADSFFQALWHPSHKVRPPFEVLHIGPAGVNWTGRVSQRLNGTTPAYARQGLAKVAAIWRGRRGKQGAARHAHERLPPS